MLKRDYIRIYSKREVVGWKVLKEVEVPTTSLGSSGIKFYSDLPILYRHRSIYKDIKTITLQLQLQM